MNKLETPFNKYPPEYLDGFFRPNHQTYRINSSRLMKVGGCEGYKFHLKINNPRYFRNESPGLISPWLNFVAKEYEKWNEYNVYQLVNAYHLAFRNGLPVPSTARYFYHNDKIYLLLTDLTAGGRYHIWGYNDRVDKPQTLFNKIKFSDKDYPNIVSQVKNICERATQSKLDLSFHNYQIRYDTLTYQHDIVLLDLNPECCNPFGDLKRTNEQEVDDFLRILDDMK